CPPWSGGNDHHFTAVFFFLTKCLFECVSVRLVNFVGDVLTNPGARFIELERRVFLRHLLHAYENFQTSAPSQTKPVSINEDLELGRLRHLQRGMMPHCKISQ